VESPNPDDERANGLQPESAEPEENEDSAVTEPVPPAITREYLKAVRRAAGFRVSPRQVAAALEALPDDEEPAPMDVAAIISASKGDVSQRQRRHGDYWLVLGARLTVQGDDGSPAGQRAFIGAARAAARRNVSDLLLLQVAAGIAEMDRKLHAEVVGRVSRWISWQHGNELTSDEIVALLPAALQVTTAEQRARRRAASALGRGRAGGDSPQGGSQSAGRRPRGSSFGGKRRRRAAPAPAPSPAPRHDPGTTGRPR
jgi:hypothetical protein